MSTLAQFRPWLKAHLGRNGLEPFGVTVPAVPRGTSYQPPLDSPSYYVRERINNVERLLKIYVIF